MPGLPEIAVIAAVIVLLFGASKLPIFAKSLGESLHIFKKELSGGDDAKPAPAVAPAPTAQPDPAAAAPTTPPDSH